MRRLRDSGVPAQLPTGAVVNKAPLCTATGACTNAVNITTGSRLLEHNGPRGACERTLFLTANDLISAKSIRRVEVSLRGDDPRGATRWASYPSNPTVWYFVDEDLRLETEAGHAPPLTTRGGDRHPCGPGLGEQHRLPRHMQGNRHTKLVTAEMRGNAPWAHEGGAAYELRMDDLAGASLEVRWGVLFKGSDVPWVYQEVVKRQRSELSHNVSLPVKPAMSNDVRGFIDLNVRQKPRV